MNFFLEASGSIASAYLIKAVQAAGHRAIASDIQDECFAKHLADAYVQVPRTSDPELWQKMESILIEKKVEVVVPSLDETMVAWAERREYFAGKGIHVIISDLETVKFCQDKWLTFQHFEKNSIPTPRTSLQKEFPLVKPRLGRGATGVRVVDGDVDMEGLVSQEYIEGDEYTVDCFFDEQSKPVYIIPRKRMAVKEGKSTQGVVLDHPEMVKLCEKVGSSCKFRGPINIQCFDSTDDSLLVLEVNPRIAGGMALGFAASENWMSLIVKTFVNKEQSLPVPVKVGMKMFRYYDEIFSH